MHALSADVEDPEFTNCPTATVNLKIYDMAQSEMDELIATDNSGLVKETTVSPAWFRRDIPLDGSMTVTYTARDAADRTATCVVDIRVNGQGLGVL